MHRWAELGAALKGLREGKDRSLEEVVKESNAYAGADSLSRVESGARRPGRGKLLRILVNGIHVRDRSTLDEVLRLAKYLPIDQDDVAKDPLCHITLQHERSIEVKTRNSTDAVELSSQASLADAQWRQAQAAWSDIDWTRVYRSAVTYYEEKGVPLFSYPCSTTKVPLYVRPSWTTLDESCLVMQHNSVERTVKLSTPQQEFLTFYNALRRKRGLTPLWNGRVFRLVGMISSGGKLELQFENGHFFDTLASQYLLEHEMRLALVPGSNADRIEPSRLPLRERLASTSAAIESACKKQATTIGVSNLILLRSGEGTYRPAVRARGKLSLATAAGILDNISSGIFDISNANTAIDLDLQYKVLKEVYEELFGKKDVEREIRQLEPDFFFEKPGIKELRSMLKDGQASFEITGFCIDLIRLAPEITTVLVVRNPEYYSRYRSSFKTNDEYEGGFSFNIPRAMEGVDMYLARKFPSNPVTPESGVGFDPSKWTLPGAFCFYQGLQKAFVKRLL